MRAVLIRLLAVCLALAVVSLAVAACDAPGSSSLNDETEPIDEDAGRDLFQKSCRTCHALADANAAGVFGPDLDLLQPDAERVREQITEGGGGMPANLLDGDDADLVARYVGEVAGRGLEDGESEGSRGGTKPSDE